jgi:flagellar motor component MotA
MHQAILISSGAFLGGIVGAILGLVFAPRTATVGTHLGYALFGALVGIFIAEAFFV